MLTSTVDTCIDAREVTVAEYESFLAAKGSDSSGQGTVCEWNDSFLPHGLWPPSPEQADLPVVEIDWCDARAYCASVNKTLCGSAEGGALNPRRTREGSAHSEPFDPKRSVWMAACTRDDTRQAPYGNIITDGLCSCSLEDAGREPVGSRKRCEGGYDGIFDMMGSVWEWVDACATEAPHDANECVALGGGFDNPCLSCFSDVGIWVRSDHAVNLGIRCCAP